MKRPTFGRPKQHLARGQARPWLGVLTVFAGALATAAWVRHQTRKPSQHVVRSRWIDAPPEPVFAAVADPRKPFLTDNPIVRMEVVSQQTEGVGTVYRWSFFLPFGLHFAFDEVVTAWEPGHRFAYKAVTGWDMVAKTSAEPEAGGTRVTFTMDCRLPLPFSLLPQWVLNFGTDLALISLARRVQGGRAIGKSGDEYIPALKYSWLTPLYDFTQRWIFRESIFKAKMVELARIEKGHRVLDLGCGTATLTILIKKMHPGAEVVGVDGDPEVLEIARSKAAGAGTDITFDRGMAYQLPYPDNSFDRVLSSLMFHHLIRENKYKAMREVLRVLRPGGEFHLADLGKPHNPLMYLLSLIFRRLEKASDNIAGLLPETMCNVGFEDVEDAAHFTTPYGTVSLYRARKPRVLGT